MKFLIVLLLALAACETDMDAYMFEQFQKFITKYEKKYSSIKEYLARFEVFRRNIMQTLQENNSYTTGVTKFSDLTLQEFKRTYLNLNYDAMAMANFDPYYVKETNAAPASWDWRSKGLVSAVKNQGSCGSCWAFSAMANLEGLYFKGRGRMEILAEQMLVDCDPYNHGCNGGFMEYSFAWLKENGGVMRQSDYPYTARKGSCQSNPSKFIDMKITGFTKLGSSLSSMYSYVDEGQIKEFLYETGPLAVVLNADPLQSYVNGILDKSSSQCPITGMNHAVTMVGYGNENGKDYWIVKNSWGANWGENGYFRIRRGTSCCGINYYITSAKVSF